MKAIPATKKFFNNELIPTNIISGYNKFDRIQGDTYFHFYNSLVDDCYKADRIFIIGYSFSDLHINAAIRGAMLNNKAQLVCIDCCDLSKYNYNYMKSKPTKEYQIDYIETKLNMSNTIQKQIRLSCIYVD